MKNFFQTLKSSFYDPEFYNHARTQPLGKGIKIFAILAVIGIGVSLLTLLPGFVSVLRSNLPQAVASAYPDDLVVSIKNGELSINKPQPYYIENNLPIISGESAPKYLVIFDKNDELSADLKSNSTFALVKNKYVITLGQNNQQQIISLSRIGTTTIQKSTVVGIVDKIEPYFIPVVLGGGLLLFLLLLTFGTVFWVIFHMIYLLVPAFIIFLLMYLRRSKIKFEESYIIALYASIPVAISFFILFQMILKIPAPEYLYTLLVVLIAALNLMLKISLIKKV